MNVLPWAGFVADFPDDQVEAGGDIKVYGGRNVAVALGEIFAGLGCSQISAPLSLDEVGWEFEFKRGDRNRFGCRVQSFHPVFWLLFEDHSLSDGEAYVELWREFGNALERDPRFHKILWRPLKDGPPDWDEVEAAADSSTGSFDEQFPPSQIQAKASHPSIWPYVIGIWLAGSGVTTSLLKWSESDLFHKIGHLVSGIFLFLIGAFFLLIAIGQGRESFFGLSLPQANQRTLREETSPRPRRPRARAAGGSLARVVIAGGLALTAAILALVAHSVPSGKEQNDISSIAIAVLLFGLAILLPVIDRLRRRKLLNSAEDPDSAA